MKHISMSWQRTMPILFEPGCAPEISRWNGQKCSIMRLLLMNWDKTFSHSAGLVLNSGKTKFTEDDTNQVTIQSDSTETIIYYLT